MSPVMAMHPTTGNNESLDTGKPMGQIDFLLSHKGTSVTMGLAEKYVPLRGDSLIGWKPDGGGAIYAFSTGQSRTEAVQYK